MDFVFMLTRADRTVANGLEVLRAIRSVGLRHIGFKDVGIEPAALVELHRAIKDVGAVSYLEVVSTSPDAVLESARTARELGVDWLLGGTQIEEVMAILDGTAVKYLPFPGRPFGHPTQLGGSAIDIARDCQRARSLGAAGVDLLAYRATDADPLELVRAARDAMDGTLLVAGGVGTPAQVRALKGAGADAFTVGSAVLDGSFAPGTDLCSQLRAVLDACG
ncbi:MAG: hypothetical protein H0V17_26670 [Deltaproteobacteria bacterium]|nr:hypothetical protein [Deltaproteobacteria bacterium]